MRRLCDFVFRVFFCLGWFYWKGEGGMGWEQRYHIHMYAYSWGVLETAHFGSLFELVGMMTEVLYCICETLLSFFFEW